MPLAQFDTPGRLRDAPAGSAFYTRWHQFVSDRIGAGSTGTGGVGEFYNATRKDVDLVGERSLVWMGFPRRLMVTQHRDDRTTAFRLADKHTVGDRRFQEEYCEWRAVKKAGKITKVTFTTEVPEYWELLFETEPTVAVNLYQQLTGGAVNRADLVTGGNYNRDNKWNTTKGIVHLTVDSLENSLGAALGLAVGAASIGTGSAHFVDNYQLQEKRPRKRRPPIRG